MESKPFWERMQQWGPWVGPSAIVALLAVLARLDACSYSPASIRTLAESNTTRIEALEAVSKATGAAFAEHLKLAEARLQIQDSEKLKLALVERGQAETQKDIAAINEKMGRMEDKIDNLYGAAIRRGQINR